MITLRPNQVEPVRAAVAYFKETKPVPAILIAPTAFGKSVLVAAILQEFPNDSFVVIQPSVELLRQNRGKFELTGNDSDVYSASFGQKSIGRITFATIGSIYKIVAVEEGDIKLISVNGEKQSKNLPLHYGFMNQNWEEVKEPVDFTEAVQAL